jgi:predicted HNH restriction endonuclease
VYAAKQALELLGRPSSIAVIMTVIRDRNLLTHGSKRAEQTLRNEMRKSCEDFLHPQGYTKKFFYQPYRGDYGLANAEYAQADGTWPSPSKRAEAKAAIITAERAAYEKAAAKAELDQTILSEDERSRFPEGEAKYLLHRKLERDTALAKKAKLYRLQKDGFLSCDICSFSFERQYGDFANGYIEAHHRTPLSQLNGKVRPRIRDLALVCSNCHRMLHFKRPWLTVEQLKARIERQVKQKSNRRAT